MIKKFEEFVSEGLWSKTFDRARTGDDRKEDFGKEYPKNEQKYIDIFLEKTGFGTYEKYKEAHNDFFIKLRQMKKFSEEDVKIIMLIIGYLMNRFTDFDFHGHFGINSTMEYLFFWFDGKRPQKLLVISKKSLHKMYWSNGSSYPEDRFCFHHFMDGTNEFTEQEIKEGVMKLINSAQDYFEI